MRKGETTRLAILDRALSLASASGLGGLTIGTLADEMSLSKSGLFAHFQSKEALQMQVLDSAAARFVECVVKPSLEGPRGRPRVEALFERWLTWAKPSNLPGGCIFVAAAVELDDRPGPVRDHLVKIQRDWSETRARVARGAVEEGHFRSDLDCEQFSHDLNGIFMAYHYASRLLRDPKARAHADAAFAALLDAARARPRAARKP